MSKQFFVRYLLFPLTVVLTYGTYAFFIYNDALHEAVGPIVTDFIAFVVACTVLSVILLGAEWRARVESHTLNKRQKVTDMAFATWSIVFLGIFHPLLLLLPEEGFFGAAMPFDDMPIWAQILWGTAFHDFFLYWWHRLEHETGDSFLWKLHLGHHSPRRLTVLSGARAHTFDLSALIVALIITRGLGMSNEAFFWVMFHPTALGGIHHSNLDMRGGIFNYIFPGPEMHRAHHRIEIDKALNYASVWPMWDWIFGTLVRPAPAKDTKMGVWYVDDSEETFGSIHAYPFTDGASEEVRIANAETERRVGKKPVAEPRTKRVKPRPAEVAG
jgi:sterol desaturase/sphingolipid hydroxylase (fatty acid hydroxylase superfamily)